MTSEQREYLRQQVDLRRRETLSKGAWGNRGEICHEALKMEHVTIQGLPVRCSDSTPTREFKSWDITVDGVTNPAPGDWRMRKARWVKDWLASDASKSYMQMKVQ